MKKIGLNDKQVEESRAAHGSNRLTEQQKNSFAGKLRQNFGDPIIKILLVALGINFLFVLLGETAWYEAAGIALAVLLAVLVATISEYRNENAFQTLQAEASKIFCKVFRNGILEERPIDDIVKGDWVRLQAGDKIPADGLLREGEIKVDQSALNGEAEEAEKYPLTGELPQGEAPVDFLHPNRVYRGSVVYSGTGVMEVSCVGDASVYGALAGELQLEEERESPLKLKLRHLAKGISRFGYIGGVVIALAFLFQQIVVQNSFDLGLIAAYCSNGLGLLSDLLSAVMLAVIIIVMAVPEGLPLMIAIVSALNMGKMLDKQVLVRKVSGMETAGSLNLLFSDKTGTITKGQMEITAFLDGAGACCDAFSRVGEGLQPFIAASGIYNSSAVVSILPDGSRSIVGGNTTEQALLNFIGDGARPEAKVLTAVPFSSDQKYSMAAIELEQQVMTLYKGVPEKLLPYCGAYLTPEGETAPLSEAQVRALERQMDALANRAIRMLLLAVCDGNTAREDLRGQAWTLVGIIGIRDEVRPEAVEAIRRVQSAGVQVVMITGDRKDTAAAIAREAGILNREDGMVLTSDELAAYSDEELKAMLPRLRVVARALPSDKSRLVRLGQEENMVVGMTGDGVNDAPALKRADVGFAMGGGTEVAKEAGDIVILDDNFRSVEQAILYGRTIFSSIRKFIVFQLTINVSAVLISFMAPLLGLPSPLSITQILWINLVMDTLAALAFGGEPALERYMTRTPTRRDEPILNRDMKSAILVGGLWTLALGLFFLLSPAVTGLFRGELYHMTGFFTFFIFTAICNAFNARAEGGNLLEHLRRNPGFLRVMGVIVVIQVALTQMGGVIFHCYGLSLSEWALVLSLSLLIIPVDLIRKGIMQRKMRI